MAKAKKIDFKTTVIESIFDRLYSQSPRDIESQMVTLWDVADGIRAYNESLPAGAKRPSDKNPANFFKDFTRNLKRANQRWPSSILARGYTGEQATGQGNCFKFIPLETGQVEAFPGEAIRYPKDPKALVERAT